VLAQPGGHGVRFPIRQQSTGRRVAISTRTVP
jgi:hypothetical protein